MEYSLKQYLGKNVSIKGRDGDVYYGRVSDFIYPFDNDPEEESIILEPKDSSDLWEFRLSDIQSIKEV